MLKNTVPDFIKNPDPNIYLSDNYVVLDFETTNIEYGDAVNPENKILLAVWYNPKTDKQISIKWGNEYQLAELVAAVEAADFLVAQNAKFELKWLKRCGLDLTKVMVYDTMIAEYVLNGNVTLPLALGPMAQRYGYFGKEPYVDICMKKGICPSELPKSLLQARCVYDVGVTRGVFLQQRKRLQIEEKLPVFLTRCLLTPALADIEGVGLKLNEERVNDEFHRASAEYHNLCEAIDKITGGINVNSPKQLSEFLYDTLEFKELTRGRGSNSQPDRTASGGRRTDAATISKLVPKTKKQREFLALKKDQSRINAELTKALTKFKECCDAGDLLHATFNQCRTATHRLSSSGTRYNVQFQNLARKFKPLFKAREDDWLLAEIDGAQLEFRVAAFLGNDEQAISDIRNGVDVHTFTADTISAAGQPTTRQEAKAHTFKPLYGGSSGTKAEVAYYTAFKEKYSGVAQAQEAWIDEVLSQKKLRIPSGLEFFWPDTKMTRTGFVTNTQSICNYPVQSFATADIIPIAITRLWHELKSNNLNSFINNTVHDSAIMEVHPEEVSTVRGLAESCFTEHVYSYLSNVYHVSFNVPLGTGFKAGKHWSEGEEITTQVEPPV
jgi:DNA polymerase I-like protein with 3'-5' exonuclease and polymerase domains